MELTNNCSDSVRKFPNHYWMNSNEKVPFDDQDTCFARNGMDDWKCYDFEKIKRFEKCENPATSCVKKFVHPTLPNDIPISINLQWSPWSECNDRTQTRTGQCFIRLERQLDDSDGLPENWSWLRKLNTMEKHLAFRDGVPLFNGLLASWLYEVESLESCLDTELGPKSKLSGYDNFFGNVLTSLFSNKTISGIKMSDNAFKYCIRTKTLDETNDALIGTYTEDKRTC